MNISKFQVDMDDLNDLKRVIKNLQKRKMKLFRETCNYKPINFATTKFNLIDFYPLFEFLYEQSPHNEERGDYYVYIHCNSNKKINVNRDIRELLLASKYSAIYVPIYVGKGIGNRCYELNRNEGHRKIRSVLLKNSKDLLVVKVKENLSEQAALFEEQKLISFLGLSSLNEKGFLINLQTDNNVIEYFEKIVNLKFKNDIRSLERYSQLLEYMKKWI